MRIAVQDGSNNRQDYFTRLGLSTDDVTMANLVHGNRVVVVTEGERGNVQEKCDALVTDVHGIILGVTAADCLPIYFWNKQKTVVGIAHAGWRGVRSTIAQEVVTSMTNEFKIEAQDIFVEVGPHIKECHFEIKDDLVEIFNDFPEEVKRIDGKIYLNLQNIVMAQLVAVGVQKVNIQLSDVCTYSSENYFSYRRDKPEIIEAMLGYIIIQK